MTIWVKWHKPWAPFYSLDLGESIIFALLQLDSEFLWRDTPISVNHSLNSAFILWHPALAARWWKHELGGAGGRGYGMVSSESHPKPATWLHVTTVFVVLYPQTEAIGDAEQREKLKVVVPGEPVQKKPGLEKVTVMGSCEPKAGAISSFLGTGLRSSLCLSFPAWSGLAEMVDQSLQLFPWYYYTCFWSAFPQWSTALK